MWRLATMAPILALLLSGRAIGDEPHGKATQHTNRLAQESSPYLLQHAHNPVDWYPWGPEAFARAQKEGKLIFLSIGYSSCHWCHVMERESFENPEVAKLLNDWFVSIKVDREERPDIDAIYMAALNVQGQRGGWPLSMFLMPDGRPIVGGTYWPPDDRTVPGGRARGFKSVLSLIHGLQVNNPKDLAAQADRVAAATRTALADLAPGRSLVELNRALVDSVVDNVKAEFDKEYGGFGSPARHFLGPKFPVPSYLELLLERAGKEKSAELTDILNVTLDHMARGGIYDQLGGGFHRYSIERTWTVPHFEKMLYDNAQLAAVYARAYRLTGKPLYRRVTDESLAFLRREMMSPEGAFYSALDADSAGGEGLSYVWTDAQFNDALPKDHVVLARKVYGMEGPPNFEQKYHVLTLPHSLTEAAKEHRLSPQQLETRLAPLRQRLLGEREHRPRPFLDTKILTGWNGQMIAGFAVAGQELKEPGYIETASRAADFILAKLRTSKGRLLRTYTRRPNGTGEARLNAYLDDYAYLADGLLCLHDATGAARWLEAARRLVDTMIEHFADKEAGGFYFTANDNEKLFARSKDQFDSAQPSSNSVAMRDLVRLWQKTGEGRYRDQAERGFKAFAGAIKSNPTGLTAMASALSLFLDGQAERHAASPAPIQLAAAQFGGGQKSDSVVKITAKAEPAKPGEDGKQVVSVTLTIDPGWHVYANPVGSDDLASSQTSVRVTSKAKLEDVKVVYPQGKLLSDATLGNYRVYEGEVTIKANVRRAAGDTGPLEVNVEFQSCNDKQCLLPATKKLTVP
jgi:uncharacterized protein YyaL (SSP411 family)